MRLILELLLFIAIYYTDKGDIMYLFVMEHEQPIAIYEGEDVQELRSRAYKEFPGRIYRESETDYVPPSERQTLNKLKEEKIWDLKSIRDEKEVEPVQTDKGLFDYDDKSRDRLAIARQALADAGGGEITWTTADNQRVSMTIADFAAINGAAAMRSNALHVKYNELKDRVNAARNESEVRAVVWVD